MQAVFNNGAGTWDNNGGKNYTLGTGLSSVENGVVSTGANPCGSRFVKNRGPARGLPL